MNIAMRRSLDRPPCNKLQSAENFFYRASVNSKYMLNSYKGNYYFLLRGNHAIQQKYALANPTKTKFSKSFRTYVLCFKRHKWIHNTEVDSTRTKYNFTMLYKKEISKIAPFK